MQTTGRPQASMFVRVLATAIAIAASTAVGPAAPAAATITGVSPAGATVDPGQGASATVSVSSQGVPPSCLTVSKPANVSASVSNTCGEGSWSARLSVATTAGTPPGTYSVTITERDKTGQHTGSAVFTLTVRGPNPTTTTARPTTTRPPTTRPPTTAPPTTAEPPTTEPPPTTTAVAALETPSLASLAARPLPKRVLFLPFAGRGRDGCVPLNDPCNDPDFELVVVPARGRDLVWEPPSPALLASLDADGDGGVDTSRRQIDSPVVAVGVDPVSLQSASFLVGGLDARPAGGRLELLSRVGATGPPAALVAGAGTAGAAPLVAAVRPLPPAPAEPLLASTLFDRPVSLPSSDVADARPALVVFGPETQVVAGLIADPAWRLDRAWLPLLSDAGVAHIGRAMDGRVGLAIPTDAAPTATAPVKIVTEPPTTNWVGLAALLFGSAALLGGGGILYTVRRR